MQLENNVGTSWQQLRVIRPLVGHRLGAGRESGQNVAIFVAFPLALLLAGRSGYEDLARLGPFKPMRPLGTNEREHVVHHRSVAGTNLGGDNPLVLVKACRDHQVLVVDRALGRDAEGLRHLEHEIRLADVPSVDKFKGRGSVGGIAALGPGLGPFDQHALLFGAEHVGVRPLAEPRVSEPRRHPVQRHRLVDGSGPGASLFVGEK